MAIGIITSRTRRLYSRPPGGGPFVLDQGCQSAQGLVSFVPVWGEAPSRDLVRPGTTLAHTSAPPTACFFDGGGLCQDLDGSADFISTSTVPVTAAPLTIACWINSDNNTSYLPIVTIQFTSGFSQFGLMLDGGASGDPLKAFTSDESTFNFATTSTGITLNRWHLGCAVFAAANSRACYIDGRSKGTDTNSRTPTGLNSQIIGSGFNNVAVTSFWNGRIGHVCTWNRALTDAEVYRLYDPPTRWELYYQLGSSVWPRLASSPGGTTAPVFYHQRQMQGMAS